MHRLDSTVYAQTRQIATHIISKNLPSDTKFWIKVKGRIVWLSAQRSESEYWSNWLRNHGRPSVPCNFRLQVELWSRPGLRPPVARPSNPKQKEFWPISRGPFLSARQCPCRECISRYEL